MEIYLAAGLGNPGKKYEETRHNAGFHAIDALADLLGVGVSENRFNGLWGEGTRGGRKICLLKPLTYMNSSGEAVAAAAGFYKIPPDHVIILFDDVNFPCGRMRIRRGGSAGGHNGMKSVIEKLGSDAFPRVRMGIGGSDGADLIEYVLGRFSPEDKKIMERVYPEAAGAALCVIESGVAAAMDRYNGLNLAEDGAGER